MYQRIAMIGAMAAGLALSAMPVLADDYVARPAGTGKKHRRGQFTPTPRVNSKGQSQSLKRMLGKAPRRAR